MQISISDMRHPEYEESIFDWHKYRLCYKGGRYFKDYYLEKFSSREEDTDFKCRKKITYIPAFAKAAINDVKNSIFQRVTDIIRKDGTKSYQDAVNGLGGGVDRRGSGMNTFIGKEILPDLLTIGKIGILVDRAVITAETQASALGKVPYIYTYPAERILSWTMIEGSPSEFASVFLEDCVETVHAITGLTCAARVRYRLMQLLPTGVLVSFFNDEGQQIDLNWEVSDISYTLKLNRIPFVVAEITQSLMADIADYQIALLNLASSDMNYAYKAGFPIYVEQQDARQAMSHLMPEGTGTASDAVTGKTKEIEVGAMKGRTYSKDPPSFIHPSSEPLNASMAKQEQLKEEIRLLVNLSLTNLQAKSASAESKGFDQESLESGLSYIGLELEHAERQIAQHWAAFEGSSAVTTVNYPEKYDLKSDAERRDAAESLAELLPKVPSKTYQQHVSKEVARALLGGRISIADMSKIESEVNTAKGSVSDPITIELLVTAGIMSKDTAADLLQLPAGEAAKAEAEHQVRIVALAAAQATKQGPASDPAARGAPDLSADPTAGSKEKINKPKRGKGKGQ